MPLSSWGRTSWTASSALPPLALPFSSAHWGILSVHLAATSSRALRKQVVCAPDRLRPLPWRGAYCWLCPRAMLIFRARLHWCDPLPPEGGAREDSARLYLFENREDSECFFSCVLLLV